MSIPPLLLLYCALSTAAYLLIVNLVLTYFEKRFIVSGAQSRHDSETGGAPSLSTQIWNMLIQWFLFAGLPMLLYSWLHLLLPLEGPRAGIAIALWTVAVGALPFANMLSQRNRVPFVELVFLMFSQLIKLAGTLAIIGILFSL